MNKPVTLSEYSTAFVRWTNGRLSEPIVNQVLPLRALATWARDASQTPACRRVCEALNKYGWISLVGACALEVCQKTLPTSVGFGVMLWAVKSPTTHDALKKAPFIRSSFDCAVATSLFYAIRPFARGGAPGFLMGAITAYAGHHWWVKTATPDGLTALHGG